MRYWNILQFCDEESFDFCVIFKKNISYIIISRNFIYFKTKTLKNLFYEKTVLIFLHFLQINIYIYYIDR